MAVEADSEHLVGFAFVPVGAGVHRGPRVDGERLVGHPALRKLYLPGDFEGYPMRKDFPLLARMIKPWPGIVDVEPMPAQDDDAAEPATETDAS